MTVAFVMYMSVGQRKFPVSIYGKVYTTLQVVTVNLVLLNNLVVSRALHILTMTFVWLTLAFCFISGLHYLYRGQKLVGSTESSAD